MTRARVEKSLRSCLIKKVNFKRLPNIIQTEICAFENGSTDTVKVTVRGMYEVYFRLYLLIYTSYLLACLDFKRVYHYL